MLLELTIRNFAVIRDTRIEFGPGLNALTGETGAGKSIVIDALGAVLGARASAELVRGGATAAYIEALFDVAALPDRDQLDALLESIGIELDPTEPLILSREVAASGRSTARVAGRSVTAAMLAAIGQLLIDIHGQSDHLSLLRAPAQLALLDRFAGNADVRELLGDQYRAWQIARARVHEHAERQRDAAHRLDLLRFQSVELEQAAVRQREDDELEAERIVLVHADRLLRNASQAQAELSGDSDGTLTESSALDRLRAAEALIDDITTLDPSVAQLLERARDALVAAEDVVASLRSYVDGLEIDPRRLEVVDERLNLLRGLKRKYGPELDDVLAYAESVQSELEAMEADTQDIEALRSAEHAARSALQSTARELSSRRRESATVLARQVERSIAELNMGNASFDVRFETSPDASGVEATDGTRVAIDASGYDRVAFMLAANAGDETRPLARVASGGETARLMLALKSILSESDETPVLVFDEVDVGVGGRSGQVVGEKLWRLTDHHQAIVISHLAQIAAFADHHLVLVKSEAGGRSETIARTVNGPERIEELAAMFDGLPPTPESRANAVALLERVQAWKTSGPGAREPR
ncbi:MAG TPA: DNA repair protein RecN [Thermomicrobiales bacterium]|nr:DNA repair protein RecN [Thermomicrobiales bacterium]